MMLVHRTDYELRSGRHYRAATRSTTRTDLLLPGHCMLRRYVTYAPHTTVTQNIHIRLHELENTNRVQTLPKK